MLNLYVLFLTKESRNQDFKFNGYMHVSKVILIGQDKDKLIKLAGDCKTAMDISEKAHIPLKDICTFIKRHTGEEEYWQAKL